MKAKITQSQKLALVLKHGTFEQIPQDSLDYYGNRDGNPIYRFKPYDLENSCALAYTQAAADPFFVINNIIRFFELK